MSSTSLQRLEHPTRPDVGGVLVTFPSGVTKALHWTSKAPVADPLAMGKDLAARALQDCLDGRRIDDAERTSWASVAAACTAIVREWNAKVRASGSLSLEGVGGGGDARISGQGVTPS